ncbi:DUF4347 domain-containing protein [Candidatus Saccharibacteria bacterium]|nr:DUF4347 domain-containing protein [Candidatus Saccharibacteria bacterium]
MNTPNIIEKISSPQEAKHSRVVDLADGLQDEERATAGAGIAATTGTVDRDPWDKADALLLTREEMDFIDRFTNETRMDRLKRSRYDGHHSLEVVGNEHEAVFANFGFSIAASEEIMHAWGTISPAVCSKEEREEYFTECLRTLKELREIDPSYPQKAYRIFGIRHFGRYPASVLARQIELIRSGKSDKPLIMVAESTSDYNNSGYTEGYRPTDIYESMVQNGDFNVVYTEVDSVHELVAQTLYVTDRLAKPASALFITGHGSKKSLELGNSQVHRDDTKELHQLKGLSDSGALTPGAELVLVSCNVGARGGLAETLSTYTQRHVVASPKSILLNPMKRLQKGIYKLSYSTQHGILRLFKEYDFGGIRYGSSGKAYSRAHRTSQALRLHD